MEETDLIPGDIIFFENNYLDADRQYSHEYIDHVAMYDGLNEQGNPSVIHSITTERGYYYPEKASGLCKTTLRALTNQIQKEAGYDDVAYDVVYKVFRFKNENIRDKALEIIRQQARYRIPYDEKRLDEKLAKEDTLDAEGFKILGMSRYREAGIYRSIKYAVRYPMPLTRTRGNGIGRGLTCSMAVILAFQIAELILDNKIRNNPSATWSSDKYSPIPIHNHYPHAYLNYLQGLRFDSDDRALEHDLRLSYDFWLDENGSPEDYTHTSFAVDAKVIGAAGLFAYMSENDVVWEYKDILHAETRHFSLTDKQQNKKQTIHAFFQALGDVREYARLSPAPSPCTLSRLNDLYDESEMDNQGAAWIGQLLSESKFT